MRAEFTIPGKVQTDHRPRVTSRGTFHRPEYVDYKKLVALVAMSAKPPEWPTDARYEVRLLVHEPDRRSRDLDNAAKGALDGMRGVLWDDDRQIDSLMINRGSVDRSNPRVEVVVRRLRQEAA